MNCRARGKRGQHGADAEGMAGQSEVRVYIAQGAQHKLAQVGAGVRQGEGGGLQLRVAMHDEVDIAGAGGAVGAVALSPQFFFNAHAKLEHLLRGHGGAYFYTGVEVRGGARRAAYGLCFVKLREVQPPENICQIIAGGFEGGESIPHVGAEGENDALQLWVVAAHGLNL